METSFHISPDENDEGSSADTDSSEDEGDNDISTDCSIFLIYASCLMQLFKTCTASNCKSPVENSTKSVIGTMLIIKSTCIDGHTVTWYSHPTHGSNNRSLGNIAIASSILLSGLSFSAFQDLAFVLKLAIFSSTTYYDIIKSYISGVLAQVWQEHRQANVGDLLSAEDDVQLAGDGQYDSPGFSGKYCTYSVMDLKTHKIIDFEVVQRKQVVVDLEKAGCERVLRRLRDADHVPITLMVTDRHRGMVVSGSS